MPKFSIRLRWSRIDIDEARDLKLIARQLGISLHTVKFYVEAVFRKLEAHSRAEAVAKGLRRQQVETIDI